MPLNEPISEPAPDELPPIQALIETHLDNPTTSWSVGCFGAIAEFHWIRDEESQRTQPLGRESRRGSITIDPSALDEQAEGLAWEAAGGHGMGWTQGVALHLPVEAAKMAERQTLTRLDDDEEGALFDIGIGAENIDACVVTDDAELTAILDQAAGQSILEDGNSAMAAIKEASPIRSFRSKVGEVRVRQHIGSRTGRPTPTGPHTHVLRTLLKKARPHDARIPVPEGRSIVLSMYPPHPTRNELGLRKPFATDEWEAFQDLLNRYGPEGHVPAKRELLNEAMGNAQCAAPADTAVARIVLPQLPYLGVSTERLEAVGEAWGLSHLLDAVMADANGTAPDIPNH